MKSFRSIGANFLGIAGLLLINSHVFAKDVSVSFTLEHRLIEQVLLEQVFKQKNKSLRVNDDGSGCHFLELSNPKVIDTKNRLLRVRVDTWARIGRAVGDQCLLLLDWHGKTDLYNRVELHKGGRSLSINVRDTKLLDQRGIPDESANQVWQWFSTNVYPVMNKVNFDLNQPIENIKSFLPVFIPKAEQKTLKQIADSFAIRNIQIKPKGILLSLHFNVEAISVSQKPVPALTRDELTLLEKKLNALDGFLSFTLEAFLTPETPNNIRQRSLETLINLRYDIVHILENPTSAGGDPVKKLFLSSWKDIAPLIRDITQYQSVTDISFGFLTFIAANEVLYTLDEIGPSLGLDISIDGLTRLARLLNADPKVNPIELKDDAVPVFQLSPKLSAKNQLDSQGEIDEDWLDFFMPRAQAASQRLNNKMVQRLNNWVPKKKEMNQYLPMVRQIISYVSDQQLRKSGLHPRYHNLYRSLVYATAWQESCWRQFAAVKGQRWPLKSRSGDLGIMQINPRVWRGFYNLHKVKWDIVYNTNSGAEILMHYLQRYALRNNEHKKTGKLENLARATYSGYNGGPRQYARYRNNSAPKKLREIDNNFYKKFLAIHKGNVMAVKQCYPGI